MNILPSLSLASLCPPPLPLPQPPLQQPPSLAPLLPQHLPRWAPQRSQSGMLRGKKKLHNSHLFISIFCQFSNITVPVSRLSQSVGGNVSSNHLAGPNVDGEVDELRVFPDEVLDGLQLQIVWGLLFHDQSEVRKRWGGFNFKINTTLTFESKVVTGSKK